MNHACTNTQGWLALSLAIALAIPACGDSDPEPADDAGARPSPDAGGDPTRDAGHDAGSACPEPSGDGTSHDGYLSASATWTQADSPHLLPQGLSIDDGVELTLEPCTVVRVGPERNIDVSGKLTALGQAGQPVRIERLMADEAWGSITAVQVRGPIALTHTEIVGGGALPTTGQLEHYAVLRAESGGEGLVNPILELDHVAIHGSGSNGVHLRYNAAFSADSTALVIDGVAGFPIVTSGEAAGTIPEGDYADNEQAAILVLTSESIGNDLYAADVQWSDRGVPYRIGGETDASAILSIGAPAEVQTARLSLLAGVELQFSALGGIFVDGPTGSLSAVGTAGNPVVFTSAASTPAAGDWLGINFGGGSAPDNSLKFVQIRYAGNPNTGTSSFSCGTPDQGFGTMGAVYFSLDDGPPTAFIQSSEIRDSASNGVDRGWTGAEVDMTAGNTFSAIAFCTQTAPRPTMGICDDPPPCPAAE
jgi:hypothetical protein